MEEYRKNPSCEYATVEDSNIGYGLGKRHIQTFLFSSMLVMSYIIRISMSVGVIAMTSGNSTAVEVFDWNVKTKGFILSSFYWGYMINQIPSGKLAHDYGPRIVVTAIMISSGLVYIIMPYAALAGGWKAVCALRMLQGICQSGMLPSGHTLLSKWAPVGERSRLGFIIISGAPIGTIIGLPLTGYLSDHFSWSKAYQILGIMSITMGLVWMYFGVNHPAAHSRISDKEKQYIETSLGQSSNFKPLNTPWKSFAKSVPVWALIIGQSGLNWAFVTMLLETPSYLNMALGINLQNSGYLSSLPFVSNLIFGIGISISIDYMINKKYCTVSFGRKLANTIGSWGLGFCLILLSFISTDQIYLCESILIIGMGLNAGFNVGTMLNHIDLSPNYAGILMGISSTVSNGFGFLAPIVIGYILQDEKDIRQWSVVFYITAAIAFISNLIFQVFGSGEKQPWNEPEYTGVEMTDMKMRNISKTTGNTIVQNN